MTPTAEMLEAFWTGAYMAVLVLMFVCAWVLVAKLINSSLD